MVVFVVWVLVYEYCIYFVNLVIYGDDGVGLDNYCSRFV